MTKLGQQSKAERAVARNLRFHTLLYACTLTLALGHLYFFNGGIFLSEWTVARGPHPANNTSSGANMTSGNGTDLVLTSTHSSVKGGVMAVANISMVETKAACNYEYGKKMLFTDHRPSRWNPEEERFGLTSFLEGTAVSDNEAATTNTTAANSSSHSNWAVCRFQKDDKSHHFPHAMQQLLRCWSFWKVRKMQQPVLLYEYDQKNFPPENTSQVEKISALRENKPIFFLQGMLISFMEVFGVKLVTDTPEGVSTVLPKYEQPAFAINKPADAHAFTQGIVDYYQMNHTRAGCPVQPPMDWDQTWPRIQVLNRKNASGRSLLNADQVAEAIASQVLQGQGGVPITYFEGENMFDQLSFFDSTDIVVSPHGAQLTGVAFMPKCGAFLEIFPLGYYVPFFFGSLAEAVDLDYYAFLMTDGDRETEAARWCKDHPSRKEARTRHICASVTGLVEKLLTAVGRWRDCCRSQLEHQHLPTNEEKAAVS